MKTSTCIKLVLPLVMSFFFFRNLILCETQKMDSWMGGGMRMFGKTDKMLYRIGGFEVNYNDEVHFVNIKNIKGLEIESQMIRILPSQERLEELLAKIKSMKWCFDTESQSIIPSSGNGCHSIDQSDILSFKVYKVNYEDKCSTLFFSELASTAASEDMIENTITLK